MLPFLLPALGIAQGGMKSKQEGQVMEGTGAQRAAETRASAWTGRGPTTQVQQASSPFLNAVQGGLAGAQVMMEGAKAGMSGGKAGDPGAALGNMAGGGQSATAQAPGVQPGAQESAQGPMSGGMPWDKLAKGMKFA